MTFHCLPIKKFFVANFNHHVAMECHCVHLLSTIVDRKGTDFVNTVSYTFEALSARKDPNPDLWFVLD